MKEEKVQLFNSALMGKELSFFYSSSFEKQTDSAKMRYLENFLELEHLGKNEPKHSVLFVTEDEVLNFKQIYPQAFLCTLNQTPLAAYFFDIEDTTEMNDLLTFFLEMKRNFLVREAILRSYVYLDKVMNLNLKWDPDEEFVQESLNIFLNEPIEVFEEINLRKFIKAIEKYTSSLNIFEEISLCDQSSLMSSFEDGKTVIPLIFSQNVEFICFVKVQGVDENRFYFNIGFVFQWLEKYYKVHHHRLALEYKRTLWEEAVQQIPFPIAMFSEDGDLVKFNDLFSQLGILPGQCLELSDRESVELNENYYVVKKERVSLKNISFTLISFYQDQEASRRRKDLSSMTSEDLGIITSSIAHELNNPLAGILAAIVLLELEDWDEESQEALKEMKESASRCKDLVRIFLGFSKASSSYQDFGKLSTGLFKALDLLRFRMIQDDTIIDIVSENKESCGEFGVSISTPVATMVFYLIFGELITQYNHQKLVAEESLSRNLEIKTFEDNKVFKISLPQNINVQSRIKGSRLLQYLINSLGLELSFEGDKLIMTTWMLM